MIVICSECKTRYNRTDKGCKIVPIPFYSKCVNNNKILTCKNCARIFKRKDRYFDECWVCHKKLCSFCMGKEIELNGLSFAFCKDHIDYDIQDLRKDAEYLFQEEEPALK